MDRENGADACLWQYAFRVDGTIRRGPLIGVSVEARNEVEVRDVTRPDDREVPMVE